MLTITEHPPVGAFECQLESSLNDSASSLLFTKSRVQTPT